MKLQPGTQQGRRIRSSVFVAATRFLWARLPWHQIIVNTPWSKDGSRQLVLFTLVRGTNQSVTIDLTNLTRSELVAFREAVLIATELAEPVVMALDEEAQEKMGNGDDSDDRVYRGLPDLVVRKGTIRQYDESILLRRADVLSRIGARILRGSPPEQPRSSLAEQGEAARPPDGEAATGGENYPQEDGQPS